LTKTPLPYQNELDTVFPLVGDIADAYERLGGPYRSGVERFGRRTVILSDEGQSFMSEAARSLGQMMMKILHCRHIELALAGSVGYKSDMRLEMTFYNWGAFTSFYFPDSGRTYQLDIDQPDSLELEVQRHGISRILGKIKREKIEIPKK